MTEIQQSIYKWILDNDISVEWLNEYVFICEDKKFLYIKHKEDDKIFTQDFNLLIDEHELEEFMRDNEHKVDYYVFEFGGKVYYSPIGSKIELNLFKYFGKAKDLTGFPYLGVHGGFELCSGSRVYEDWCTKASFLGVDVLGICERNTLAGTLKFQNACKDAKIKSIIGETVKVKGSFDIYDVKLFVINEQGWSSLLKINKLINVDSEDHTIDENELCCGDYMGLVVVLGEVALTDAFVELYSVFDFLYYQFDPVQFKSKERDVRKLTNLKIYLDKYRNLISPILICDTYYLDQEDHYIKKMLNTIGNLGFEFQSEDQYFKPLENVYNI